MNRVEVGRLFKEKRTERGLSLQKMAEKIYAVTGIEISPSYLSTLERGGLQQPNLAWLRAIANVYRIDPQEVRRVFIPSDEDIDRAEKIEKAFNIVTGDQTHDADSKAALEHETLSIGAKLCVVRMYEQWKNRKILSL